MGSVQGPGEALGGSIHQGALGQRVVNSDYLLIECTRVTGVFRDVIIPIPIPLSGVTYARDLSDIEMIMLIVIRCDRDSGRKSTGR